MSFGFGSGFGAPSSSPFGAASPSPFGQAPPAFGQSTSPFGSTTTTGVFGQQQQQAQPAFGAAPAFGASAPAFGAPASQPAFGATATPAFGAATFGAAKPAGGFGFGAPASSASPFGAASTPAFGAPSSTPAFGAAPSPFGAPAASTGFGQSAPAFGAPSSTPAFGAAPSAFGAPSTGFGAPQPATGAFGSGTGFGTPAAAVPTGRGSRIAAWRKTQEVDTSSTGAKSTVYFNSISCMPEYAGKSHEEIRWEDYQDGVKGGGGAASPPGPASGGGLFGAPAAPAAPSPFGAPAGGAAPSPFGAASTPAFGAASTPAFGASATPAFGGFGAASTPAFGGVSTPAFGFGSTPSPSPFGSTAPAAPFGQSAPAFGAASTPAFGATSAPAFGAASAPAFGATSAPSFGGFGAASTPAFGAASAPSFGGFGATSAPAFGATSAPAFGAASTPAFSFGGAASTPAFGATTSPTFGATTAGGASLFGGTSTPAFGGTPSLFGATAAKPATTPGFGFGGLSTPAFGATTTPAFGATSGLGGSGGGLFGGTSTPAFGAPPSGGGGLFGGASTPSFSFAPAAAPGALAMAPQGGPQMQPPGVATSPYGTLPEAPRVTPLPEYRVGLMQRVLAPPSGGPPRHVTLITPRSLTPHAGGKLRPRSRSTSASRMSRNPAEYFATVASGGGTPGSGIGGGGGGGAFGSGNGVSPASAGANLFVPRDNPRKLFIRDTLPGMEAAGGVHVSPATAAGGAGPSSTPGRALRTPGSGLRVSPGLRRAGETPNGDSHPLSGGRSDFGANGGGRLHRELNDTEVGALLPSLRRPDYYTEPSLTQLAAMARDDPDSLAEVANFTVGRRGVGAIRWLDPVDVRGLDLDGIVSLARGAVEVYLDGAVEKPEVGSGLNRPAEVTMLKVFKVDKATGKPVLDLETVARFTRKLKKVAAEQGARFESYDGSDGTWKFEVEHFSRYGLMGDDSEDEEEAEGAAHAGRGSAAADFRRGDGRKVFSSQAAAAASGGSDHTQTTGYGAAASGEGDEMEDDFDTAGFGVRRQRQGGVDAPVAAAATVVEGDRFYTTGAAVAGMETEGVEYYGAGQEGEAAMDEAEAAPAVPFGEEAVAPYVGAPARQLQLSLPAMTGAEPEDLLRIRNGLFPGAESQARMRRVDGDTWAANAQAAADSALPEQFGLTARNAWRRQAQGPLRPPSALPPHTAAAPTASHGGGGTPQPLLPTTPSPVSPIMVVVQSPCPVKAPAYPSGKERCLPDAGLFMGPSFRVGWGQGAMFAGQGGVRGASAGQVTIRQMVLGGGVVADPGGEAHRVRVRGRLKDMLRVHYDNSLPDADKSGLGGMGSGGGEAAAPPRWRLQCSRGKGSLRDLTLRFIQLCDKHASAVPGAEHVIERTVLRHQASAWELLHALFSELPAEAIASPLSSAAMATDDGNIDSEMAGRGDEDEDTSELAAMQRRAALSRWLRDRSSAATERAAAAARRSHPSTLLSLLGGHQLAAAAAAAAEAGDVRLATLLAVGGASSGWRSDVVAQLSVWRDAGFEQHINPARLNVYRLLAGHLDDVIPGMDLDWRRALGCYLWYGCHPAAPAAAAVDVFYGAVQSGIAPAPVPLYMERLSQRAQHSPTPEDPLDVNFELLRLFCSQTAAPASASIGAVLARLLRPAGVTPDPLDHSFTWLLLCVLRAIGAAPSSTHLPAAALSHAGFISQLLAVGRMAHWAVYVALHLPDASHREEVVKEILARTVPEWNADAEVSTFLVESLQVPAAWVAGARALWARHTGDAVEELAELLDSRKAAAAHTKLCRSVAPGWLLAGGDALHKLESVLAEMEGRAAEIDAAAGGGSWDRGGGLYSNFLFLRGAYAEMEAGGGAVPPPYQHRMSACAELADKLNAAMAAVTTGDGLGKNSSTEGREVALQRAALAKMSQELAGWVLGDARGEGAVPDVTNSNLMAGLRPLRQTKRCAAIQMGAVKLAEGLA